MTTTDAARTHHYLCTGCPLGCRLEVDAVEDDIIEIRGFECKIGERYAEQEHSDPRRPVSTTVRFADPARPRLPVRTADAVPKRYLREVVQAAGELRITRPVRIGEVLLRDVGGSGSDLIATRSMTPAGQAAETPPLVPA